MSSTVGIVNELKISEFASLFPEMSPDEFKSLVEDIRINGQLEPVTVLGSEILDGRNRYLACKELGIPVKFQEYDGSADNLSLLKYVGSKNLKRRHLSVGQLSVMGIEIHHKLVAERQKQLKNNLIDVPTSKKTPTEEAAEILDIGYGSMSAALNIEKNAPELLSLIKNNVLPVAEAQKLSKKTPEEREKVIKKIQAGEAKNVKTAGMLVKKEERFAIPENLPLITNRYKIIHDEISNLWKHIEPDSLDLMLVDPPYPREYIPVYKDLAEQAVKALKPGGSLVCMIGQSYLPQILKLMEVPDLNYQWLLSYLTFGGTVQIWQREILCGWKPLLWFIKGDYKQSWQWDVFKENSEIKTPQNIGKLFELKDVVNSDTPDKSFHTWGQSIGGITELVLKFSKPGDTVCDCFLGGGSTGEACLRTNRLFIGLDNNINAINVSKLRLATVCNELAKSEDEKIKTSESDGKESFMEAV